MSSVGRESPPPPTRQFLRCSREAKSHQKHRWHRLYKEGIITYRSYNEYAADTRRLLRVAEEEYYARKLSSFGDDMKRNWQIMNKLLGKKKVNIPDHFNIQSTEVSNPSTIAKSFCEYFINHPLDIHSKISLSTTDFISQIQPNEKDFYFHPTTPEEVKFYIQSLRKNGGLYDITRRFLIICDNHATEIISKLFNLCIEQRTFPECLKTAVINPIYKKGNRNLIKNYRPISILTNISKIFETLIYNRLQSFFQENQLLSYKQFGYRKNSDTEQAIFELIAKIMPAIANKKYCICVFLDYSACFDTLSRDILLKKLERYGVRGAGNEIMRSYFSRRKQKVMYKSHLSPEMDQNMGVIQGSKTGPLLFDIYATDFDNICTDDENILYADDTCLVYTGESLTELVDHVNGKLKIVLDWCNCNKLSLNPIKSQFMLITSKIVSTPPIVYIGEDRVTQVDTFKYLGMYIDSNLKFHDQISHIKTKMSRLCGVSWRLRNHFSYGAAMNMYYACIYSTFAYCISTWGGIFLATQRGNQLLNLQNKIVNNLFAKFSSSQETCLYKKNKLLKMNDVYKLRIATIMYRIMVSNELPRISHNIDLNYPQHEYNTRGADLLRPPFPRVEAIRMGYQYQIIDIWNNIPLTIKQMPTAKAFKRALSDHFLDAY